MCNTNINHSDPFADIADLEDKSEWDGSKPAPKASSNPHLEDIGSVEVPGFVENCPKCRGTGSYGRVTRLGHSSCTKCKGTGKLQFKTSPEARAKARKSAAARKERVAKETYEAGLASLPEDVREWLLANNELGNSFASSLLGNLRKYGSLTENQIGGVRKCIARDDDAKAGAGEWIENHEAEHAWLVRESEAGNEFANDLLNGQWGLLKRGFLSDGQLAAVQRNLAKDVPNKPSDIDLSGLPLHKTGGGAERSYFAVPDGDTRLKLCVRRPGKQSRYHGWTFVDDGAAYGSRRTYGKQGPDGLYQGDVQDQLRAILKDPLEASIAYGKLVGTCGVCGRALEDEQSVAAGIGPVCASKYS